MLASFPHRVEAAFPHGAALQVNTFVRHWCGMARDDPEIRFRAPPPLRDRIAAAARKNNRSMNAELVARLTETFLHEDAGQIPDAQATFDLIKQTRLDDLMKEIAKLAEAKFDQAARDWLKRNTPDRET